MAEKYVRLVQDMFEGNQTVVRYAGSFKVKVSVTSHPVDKNVPVFPILCGDLFLFYTEHYYFGTKSGKLWEMALKDEFFSFKNVPIYLFENMVCQYYRFCVPRLRFAIRRRIISRGLCNLTDPHIYPRCSWTQFKSRSLRGTKTHQTQHRCGLVSRSLECIHSPLANVYARIRH